MSIHIEKQQDSAIIQIEGKFLGSVHGDEFKSHIDALKEEGIMHVVVDLGKTTFMDSSGVGTLIGGLTSLRKVGGDMRLARLKERIHGLFMMMHLLGPAFKYYDTVDEALESFDEEPAERMETSA